MRKLRGISKSLELFIGLAILLLILMITFKLFGIWMAYEYEQQAQITAKRLQTAMNFVCAYGEPTEVEINLPQKLSPRGTNPAVAVFSALFSPISEIINTKAIADATRYILALRSYGDPWYVIYFERFPEGEDTWAGWDEVVAMRTTSATFRAIEVASCVVPLSIDTKKIFSLRKWASLGKKVAKGVKEAVHLGENTREAFIIARIKLKTTAKIAKVREIYDVNKEVAEKLFSKEFSKAAPKLRASSKEVFRWITSHSSRDIENHFGEAEKVIEFADSMPTIVNKLKKGPKLGSELGESLDSLSKTAERISIGDIANADVRTYVENIRSFNLRALKLDNFASYLKQDMDEFKNLIDYRQGYLGRENALFLKKLVDKIKDDAEQASASPWILKFTHEEIEHARELIDRYLRWDKKAVAYMDELEAYASLRKLSREIEPNNIISDSKNWRWTKAFYEAEKKPFSSRLRAFLYGIPQISITETPKFFISKEAKKAYSRWGVWYLVAENPIFSFSDALSLTDVAMMKLAPCGENALCLKSQVNPSIAIYPLKECEKRGVKFVELDKFAEKTEEFMEEDIEIKVEDVTLPQGGSLPGSERAYLSCVENSRTHKIYCFGGERGNFFSNQIFEFSKHEIASVKTTYPVFLPLEITGLSCAEDSSTHSIYCFGGYNGNYLDKIFKFEPESNSIKELPLKIPPIAYLSCTENSKTHKIYCFGGYNGTNYLDKIIEFDPANNKIKELSLKIPARAYLSCTENSKTHKIYCFGGYNGSYLNDIFVFDGSNIRKLTVTLPRKVHSLSCAEDSFKHKIYCFGGIANITSIFDPDGSIEIISEIFVFNGTDIEMLETIAGFEESKLKIPYKVYGLSCAQNSYSGKIYCFGGITENGETNKIFEFIPLRPIFQEAKGVHSWAGSPYTRFYAASPCEGKAIISLGRCKCRLVEKPYIDYTSQNIISFNCKVVSEDEAECKVTKYLDYSGEEIELGTWKGNLNSVIEEGTVIAYEFDYDLKDAILNLDEKYNHYYSNYEDFKNFYDSLASENYFVCRKIIEPKLNQEFSCRFSLPEIPFNIKKCVRDELVLNCTEWVKIGEAEVDVPGMEETKKEEVWEWCCKKWMINELKGSNKQAISEIKGEIYSSKDCIHDENEIRQNLNALGLDSDTREGVERIISENSIITLKKGINLSDESIANNYDFFVYGLDNQESTTDCLRIKFYTKPETKGFCYTAPPDNEFAKEILITAGSILADTGVSTAGNFILKSFGPFGFIASVAGCEIGNLITWYGQNMITEEREKRLWPNNPYFGNYFLE